MEERTRALDGGLGYSTDAVVRARIERQLTSWNVERTHFRAEYQNPMSWTAQLPSLMMTFSDSEGMGWYDKYTLSNELLAFISHTSLESALHTVNNILRQMQRNIGEVRRGPHPD